jgi:hypothetical protein
MLHGLLPGASVARVYLYANAVDMRRSFNGFLLFSLRYLIAALAAIGINANRKVG